MIDMADTYMCRRCGAIVANSAASKHGDWHERVETALKWVEYEDSEQARRANGG
jgi:hypothetical protein